MRALLFPISLILAMTTSTARSEDWKPLTDEPSRADLFLKVIQSDMVERGLPAPTEQEAKSFAFHNAFNFPHDVIYDVDGSKRKNSLFLIDISHYTDKSIKLRLLKAQGVIGVYTKAGQGVNYRDTSFPYFWTELGKLKPAEKVYRGAYYFLSASSSGESQAKAFIKIMRENGISNDDLPPVVDLEWDVTKSHPDDAWKSKSPEEIVTSVLEFLKYIDANGEGLKKPMIYTARSFLMDRVKKPELLAKLRPYPLWQAEYSATAQATELPKQIDGRQYDLWQFTESAKLGIGYDKKLDANVFKGTEEEFASRFVSSY